MSDRYDFMQSKMLINSLGMRLLLIPRGSFLMGSSEDEFWYHQQQHEVTLSQDFYLGVTPITQVEYERVMGHNPSSFQDNRVSGESSSHPVEGVSWEDAEEFCRRLSQLPGEQLAGREYRLPTEAEWEYACRAGSQTAYCFGDAELQLG